jgi:hypothetical protein
MGRIKIKDLPKDVEISKEEMKKMTGRGFVTSAYGGTPTPTLYSETFNVCQFCSACSCIVG